MGHDDHREEIIELQNQSQLIEAENNELKKKVTLYEEEFRKVKDYLQSKCHPSPLQHRSDPTLG